MWLQIKILLKLLGWDIILLFKYSIMPIAVGIGLLYIVLIHILSIPSQWVVLLIFSDPSMMGFLFIGVMVLFEKQAGTTSAIAITPIQPWQYLTSKSISLTIPAVIVSTLMAIATDAPAKLWLILITVTLTSIFFLLLGYIGSLRVRSFNEYFIVFPTFLAPLCIPLLSYLDVWHSPLMWFIPTHATLVLLGMAFSPIHIAEMLTAVTILVVSIVLVWKWANSNYINRMAESNL